MAYSAVRKPFPYQIGLKITHSFQFTLSYGKRCADQIVLKYIFGEEVDFQRQFVSAMMKIYKSNKLQFTEDECFAALRRIFNQLDMRASQLELVQEKIFEPVKRRWALSGYQLPTTVQCVCNIPLCQHKWYFGSKQYNPMKNNTKVSTQPRRCVDNDQKRLQQGA